MGRFEPLRRSSIAGTWYPSEPAVLRREVDAYLDAAAPPPPLDVRGLIVPHAGLVYSGPVAAHAYRAVRGGRFDVVVLVGPSHFVDFDGVSVFARGAYETPLGPAVVDAAVAAGLLARDRRLLIEYPRAHAREHSVEMPLPFLRRVLPDTPIVPLVMGRQTRETMVGLGRLLADGLADRRALLVASTDLSHYFDATEAARLDARVVEHVSRFDDRALLAELEGYPDADRGRYVACGGGPTVAVMRAAQRLGSTQAAVLARADSGDVSGDRTRVVGYLAAVVGAAA